MSILLDTHVILWWLTDDPALSDEVTTRLDDEPDVYVSPASLWEVTIKQSTGKLSEPVDVAEELRDSGYSDRSAGCGFPGRPSSRKSMHIGNDGTVITTSWSASATLPRAGNYAKTDFEEGTLIVAAMWLPEQLERIGMADELQIAGRRADGTLRRWTPIWVVNVGDQVYVRTWYRRESGWFGHVLDSPRARIRVPRLEALSLS